jgi:hypothetical protein
MVVVASGLAKLCRESLVSMVDLLGPVRDTALEIGPTTAVGPILVGVTGAIGSLGSVGLSVDGRVSGLTAVGGVWPAVVGDLTVVCGLWSSLGAMMFNTPCPASLVWSSLASKLGLWSGLESDA